ncbi:methylated-dna-[protein]-cysteine s-methyltransferase active site [Lucifera butyrica]|uniref:Methylated-DNA--protein-cysteine methyltransferase n=1 Tax=Lucifera butyrica TaxID=1351585 RepID=A0A498R7U8_9FIRM|nr:methylated-DNA--[protein]-cysteine S-methyltransferase [Lucifera butyrica]VBB07259.1 methylated-dna-[protein]-cysteine s-methyltransferase active site [Lucifera butyrica]
MNVYFCNTMIGEIGIAEMDGSITNLYFGREALPKPATEGKNSLLVEASHQLDRYLAGELKRFTLPLNPVGTAFMQQVWSLLGEIPYGRTATYKEIALKMGKEKAARAIGLASSRNPIPIFIPCHRVIGTNGTLTGYRGGLALKKILLSKEGTFGNAFF